MTSISNLSVNIANTIREQQLFNPGDTLIVGLSGGADSTALIDLLANLPGVPLRLVAAHLNHCLRGATSDADEEFCRVLAEYYKIPFVSRRVDLNVFSPETSRNLEDAGRQARIAFFNELLITWRATAVVLAHHADDQAETVLMRLIRGSGMTGMSGMSYKNGRGYVRPLLDITRAQIEEHLTRRGLVWCEDSSNLDQNFLRNRIRHELLPLLEQYNPALRAGLVTTANILSAENDLLDSQARHAADQTCQMTAHGTTIDIAQLLNLHPALQRRVLRWALAQLHGNLEQFDYHHIEAICRLAISPRPNSQINLPHGIVAVKQYEALVLYANSRIEPQPSELIIPGPGIYSFHDSANFTVERSTAPVHFDKQEPNIAYLDLDKAPFPWLVRTFLPGDRIHQLGMTGKKKVKDLFIDCKTPLAQRSRTPLVFCKNELLWVGGLRTAHHAHLDSTSSRVIKIKFSQGE